MGVILFVDDSYDSSKDRLPAALRLRCGDAHFPGHLSVSFVTCIDGVKGKAMGAISWLDGNV